MPWATIDATTAGRVNANKVLAKAGSMPWFMA